MLNITEDVQPLTISRNNSVKMMRQLKQTQRPIVLTVNGKTEAVVLDALAYQKLQDLAALASEEEGLRQGEEDIRACRMQSAREALEEIRLASGISR